MDSDCSEIKELNRQTFAAEEREKIGDQEWDAFLEKVLATDFEIRRSNPRIPNQTRNEMIEWIGTHPAQRRRVLHDEAAAWCHEDLGVIVCPVEMADDKRTVHRYQNVKVFTRSAGQRWQCVYWQVGEAPTG